MLLNLLNSISATRPFQESHQFLIDLGALYFKDSKGNLFHRESRLSEHYQNHNKDSTIEEILSVRHIVSEKKAILQRVLSLNFLANDCEIRNHSAQ